MSFGGSSGSSGSIHASSDVALSNPADGQNLTYNASLSKWQNQTDSHYSTITANAQSGNYTLALSDAGGVIDLSSSSAATVTVPANSSVAFAVGTVIELCQLGTGQITVSGANGVTLHTSSSLTTRAQYATAMLRQQAPNVWILGGDLT